MNLTEGTDIYFTEVKFSKASYLSVIRGIRSQIQYIIYFTEDTFKYLSILYPICRDVELLSKINFIKVVVR
jgi:hypothetical protein